MTSYFSVEYFGIFLPITAALYYVLPKKFRWFPLLAAGCSFYWIFSKALISVLIGETAVIYFLARRLDGLQTERKALSQGQEKDEKKRIKEVFRRKQRRVVLLGVLINVGTLLVFKYTGFFAENINALASLWGKDSLLTVPKLALPLGISFFTLQGVSYVVDVYNGKVAADRNFLRLALYMSFFPNLMEGPICKYEDTAGQLWECRRAGYKEFAFGLQRILYGTAKKIVVADRVNAAVNEIFKNYDSYDGGVIALGMVLYTVQLYMDFSGTMDVVIGSGELFGVKLPENFRQPFFAKSISDFWTRWHITLGIWFRDYIFYPLSMSKGLKNVTAKGRKALGNHFGPLIAGGIALLAVWLCNGLWHGAAWSYIFFGLYHFMLIFLGSAFEPLSQRVLGRLHIDRGSKGYSAFRILRTVVLVNFGELFFRANTLRSGFAMLGKIFTNFSFRSFADGTIYELGMETADYHVVIAALLMVLAVSALKEKGIDVREAVAQQNIVIRWGTYMAVILFIVVFGAYGVGYIPVDPMYANF